MAGMNPWGGSTASFVLPTSLYELEEWVADSYIDGPLGQNCTLIYPDKWTQCDNCIMDLATQRSSNVYKSGGPVTFPANSLCPRCNGEGRSQVPVTETVRLRVYWNRSGWIDIGVKIANPDGVAMCMGYASDIQRVERANKIILNADLTSTRVYECVREGEAKPYGMRRNRYFIQYMRRTGGG